MQLKSYEFKKYKNKKVNTDIVINIIASRKIPAKIRKIDLHLYLKGQILPRI